MPMEHPRSPYCFVCLFCLPRDHPPTYLPPLPSISLHPVRRLKLATTLGAWYRNVATAHFVVSAFYRTTTVEWKLCVFSEIPGAKHYKPRRRRKNPESRDTNMCIRNRTL